MARRMVYKGSLDGSAPILKKFTVAASQNIVSGSIVKYSSNKVSAAASGDAGTPGLMLGVAYQSVTTSSVVGADDTILVDTNPMSIYEIPFATGGSKTSFDNEDLGKLYDLGANAYTLDPDDTTDGFLRLVGFNNGKATADVTITSRVEL